MALRIKWNKKAEQSFDRILVYLQDEFGFNTASKFAHNVFKTLDLVAEFPEIGSTIREHKQIKGLVLVKQVSLFYRFDEKQLIVLNLFDNRKKPKEK
ncbi:MAG: type II toxin-antitoxin system RelE/ParE family toxin [Flavobacteriia bacterium]|jgi:plasmid stabilization system protein ParE